MIIALRIITHAVQFITILTCLWYLLKNKLRQPYRFFAAGWVIFLAHDLSMVIIGLINPAKNHWVYNIAFPLLQLFCMWLFMSLLQQKKIWLVMSLFSIFACLNLALWQGATTLNTYSLTLGGVIILLLASTTLFRLYRQQSPESIFKEPVLWISTGFIFYWAIATPFFAMYNYLWQNFPTFFIIYFFTVSYFFITGLNLCIIKSLQCSLNTAKK
jgi:hypothetical protein